MLNVVAELTFQSVTYRLFRPEEKVTDDVTTRVTYKGGVKNQDSKLFISQALPLKVNVTYKWILKNNNNDYR